MSTNYSQSTVTDLQEVMEVENTVSPKMLFGAPNDRPLYDCPDLRCNTAGGAEPRGPAWVANVLESRMERITEWVNMI
jgi:hypothetical protein